MRLIDFFALALLSVLGAALQAQEPAPATPVEAGALSEKEQRGKEIYLTGKSPTGEPVIALMGESQIEVPASTLPCGNCHGRDGKGKPEGGVTPTNLTWAALTKPYGVRHESGREHPPYTVPLLKRAITMGFDPAGNELHAAMPRYRMTIDDMEALVTYIQRLGTDPDPGVSVDALHLGTLLPPEGQAEGVGEAIETVLTAFVAEVNQRGGLYGRHLILHVHRLAAEPSKRRVDVEAFLDSTPIFALVGAFIAGAEEEITSLLAQREIPLVGPFTLRPQTGFPINRQVFYLLAGLATQGRVLVDFAAERHPAEEAKATPPAAVVVFSSGGAAETAVEAMEAQARLHGWELARRPLASEGAAADSALGELIRDLAKEGIERVFVMDAEALTPELLAALPTAELFVPGAFAHPALLESAAMAAGRLFFAFPTLPEDQGPDAVVRYRHLVTTYDLPRRSLTTQLATLAAAEVLEEGLKQGGREISRDKLIETLETLYDYRTGLLPPLTFNPNRRIGALGAYVVRMDPETGALQPVGGFRKPAERP